MTADSGSLLPQIGDVLPETRVVLDSSRLVAYAGATWDWHPLHHDTAFAGAAGLERPVADGQMFGALLVAVLRRWAGDSARLESLAMRYRSLVYAGETVTLGGRVTGVETENDRIRIHVEQTVHSTARIAVSATTALLLPGAAVSPVAEADEGTPR